MQAFISSDGFAIIQTIEDRKYTLERFNNEEEWRTCQPPQQKYTLIGTPNITDILAVLPNGYQVNEEVELPLKSTPPDSISALQIRKWLILNNISLDSVVSLINNITDPQTKQITLAEWEYAPYIERQHPMVSTIGSLLNLSDSDLDNAFLEAEKL